MLSQGLSSYSLSTTPYDAYPPPSSSPYPPPQCISPSPPSVHPPVLNYLYGTWNSSSQPIFILLLNDNILPQSLYFFPHLVLHTNMVLLKLLNIISLRLSTLIHLTLHLTNQLLRTIQFILQFLILPSLSLQLSFNRYLLLHNFFLNSTISTLLLQ